MQAPYGTECSDALEVRVSVSQFDGLASTTFCCHVGLVTGHSGCFTALLCKHHWKTCWSGDFSVMLYAAVASCDDVFVRATARNHGQHMLYVGNHYIQQVRPRGV